MTKREWLAKYHPEIERQRAELEAKREAFRRHCYRRFPLYFGMAVAQSSGLGILALVVAHWWRLGGSVLCYLWIAQIIFGACLRRPPANYGSYREWYADRANWWRRAE